MATELRLEMIWPPNGSVIGPDANPVIHGQTHFVQRGLSGGLWVFDRFEWNIRQVATGNHWNASSGSFTPGLRWWPAGQGQDPGQAVDTNSDQAVDILAGVWEYWTSTDGTDAQIDFAVFPDGEYVFTIAGQIAKLPSKNRRRSASAQTTFTVDATRPSIVITEPQGDIVDRMVSFAGVVADDHFDTISWAIRDREFGDHWHDGSGFRESLRRHPLPTQSGSWKFEWRGGAAGSGDYELIVRAVDEGENEIELVKPFRTDFGPPALTVKEPQGGAEGIGPMVEFTGLLQARNAGSAYVRLGITDRSTGEGWNFDRGTWGHPDGEYVLFTRKIWDGFEYVWDGLTAGALGGSGKYRAELTCRQDPSFPQAAGNTVVIDFTTAAVDFVYPRSMIDQPVDGVAIPNGVVTISGTAEDPTGLMLVRVLIERVADGFSWDATVGDFTDPTTRQDAAIGSGGSWSLDYDLSGQAPGEYHIVAFAINAANFREPFAQRPTVDFLLT